jgi:hypothetical protein
MLIAALFKIARKWKQPQSPSTNDRLVKCGEAQQTVSTSWNLIQQSKNGILIHNIPVDTSMAGMNF